jgi:hypothetical protein
MTRRSHALIYAPRDTAAGHGRGGSAEIRDRNLDGESFVPRTSAAVLTLSVMDC